MCFYEQFEFACKDFRWGNFRQHCNKEYRRGETCGMKLVHEVVEKPENCTICEKLSKKMRRYYAYEEKLKKWEAEGRLKELRATVQKTREDMEAVRQEIVKLDLERQERAKHIGGNRRAAAHASQSYHAATSQYANATPGYGQAYPYGYYAGGYPNTQGYSG